MDALRCVNILEREFQDTPNSVDEGQKPYD